jgi:hypothetical protein
MRIEILLSAAIAFAAFVAAAPVAPRSFKTSGGNTCGLAPICLPRVPWEGGPAYWAQFAPTTTAGWTNPSCFPIAIWQGVSTNSQSQINAYLAVGVNGFVSTYSGDDVALIRSNGMFAVPTWEFNHALPTGMGVETVGFLIADEPELNYGKEANGWTGAASPRDTSQCIPPGSGCGQTVMSTNKANLPHDGHPFTANYSYQILTMPLANSQPFVRNFTNYASHDIFWYSDGSICAGDRGVILGTPPGHDLTSDECHRSSNYGVALAKFRALTSPLQPVFGLTSLGGISGPHLRGSIWNNIINEARGVVLFNWDTACGGTGDIIVLNCGGLNPDITTVSGQIRALATVLNTQSFQWTFNANINSMLKFGPDGKWYIFAMQAGFNDTGIYTFTLPTGFTAASIATVLNESRTVPISGGAFSDTFANESTYHIYQIAP